jgi:hypothetical protein
MTAIFLNSVSPVKVSEADPDTFKAFKIEMSEVIGFKYDNKVFLRPHETMIIEELIYLIYYGSSGIVHADTQYKFYEGEKFYKIFDIN